MSSPRYRSQSTDLVDNREGNYGQQNTLPFLGDVRAEGKIGSGASGDVYKVVDTNGEEMAYKIFNGDGLSGIDRTLSVEFVREAGLYKHLGNRNPGLCKISEIGDGYISMYLATGDLLSEMKNVEERDIGDYDVKQYRVFRLESALEDMATLLASVDLLHKENVGHFDIKPANIMRMKNGELKLCDLGSASVISGQQMQIFENARDSFKRGEEVYISDLSHMATGVTMEYAAPETYLEGEYGGSDDGLMPMYPAADMWSLGIVFFELMTGYNLYKISIKRDKEGNLSVIGGGGVMGNVAYMAMFTEDMNREGFSIYDRNWESVFGTLSNYRFSNKASPYELLLSEQSKGSASFGEKELEDVNMLWELINKMLDPNPLTRITASECLMSPLFYNNMRVREHLKDFYLDYKRRLNRVSEAKEDILFAAGSASVPRDFGSVSELIIEHPKGYRFLRQDKVLATRMENMLRFVYYKIGPALESNVSKITGLDHTKSYGERRQLLQFCTMVLASYAEAKSKIYSRPDLEIPHMMREKGVQGEELDTWNEYGEWGEPEMDNGLDLEGIQERFLDSYSGSQESLRTAIYTLTYFLLVKVFEFDLWIM